MLLESILIEYDRCVSGWFLRCVTVTGDAILYINVADACMGKIKNYTSNGNAVRRLYIQFEISGTGIYC